MNKLNLPEATLKAIRKHGIRKLTRQIIKSLLFWAISMTVLFVTGSQNDLFNPTAHPIWFWGVFLILIAFPFWKWKLYQLFVCRKLYATVEGFKNRRTIGNEDGEYTGGLSGVGLNLHYIDFCAMFIRSDKGLRHRFTAANEKAGFIRSIYEKGDRVFYPMFAAYPINLSRSPSRPFCVCCGYIGTEEEEVCPDCGVPFVKKSTSEDEQNSQSF